MSERSLYSISISCIKVISHSGSCCCTVCQYLWLRHSHTDIQYSNTTLSVISLIMCCFILLRSHCLAFCLHFIWTFLFVHNYSVPVAQWYPTDMYMEFICSFVYSFIHNAVIFHGFYWWNNGAKRDVTFHTSVLLQCLKKSLCNLHRCKHSCSTYSWILYNVHVLECNHNNKKFILYLFYSIFIQYD